MSGKHSGEATGFNLARFFVQHRQVAWALLVAMLAWGVGLHTSERGIDRCLIARLADRIEALQLLRRPISEQVLRRFSGDERDQNDVTDEETLHVA